MELGPIQKAWIKSLRENPERQMDDMLGLKNEDGTYKACCLGEGGLIAGVCFWDGNILRVYAGDEDIGSARSLNCLAYEKLGLTDRNGSKKDKSTSLVMLNDDNYTWPQIADFLEKNPDDWFTHSV